MPDGREPAYLVDLLGVWVQDCIRLMDGNGAFTHYPHGSALYDEPAIDMDILDVVRSQWNNIRNQEQEKKWRETRSQSR